MPRGIKGEPAWWKDEFYFNMRGRYGIPVEFQTRRDLCPDGRIVIAELHNGHFVLVRKYVDDVFVEGLKATADSVSTPQDYPLHENVVPTPVAYNSILSLPPFVQIALLRRDESRMVHDAVAMRPNEHVRVTFEDGSIEDFRL